MKELSKEQIAKRDGVVEVLRERAEKLDNAVISFNHDMEQLYSNVQIALDQYNEAVSEANEFRDEIAQAIQSHIDEKIDDNEDWGETEKGESYTSWYDQWNSTELEEGSVEEFTEIETSSIDAPDDLEQLPEEPE